MSKTVAQSETHFSKLISPSQSNPAGRVYAGEIMQIMYNAAHKVAHQHSDSDVTAAKVDEMVFLHPAFVGTVITCHAFLTFVGKTSMEVEVNLYSEGLSPTTPILSSYFVMVAMDEHHPKAVPALELTNDAERARFEAGKQRYLCRKS
jgi:acyl-CoA hydrolase